MRKSSGLNRRQFVSTAAVAVGASLLLASWKRTGLTLELAYPGYNTAPGRKAIPVTDFINRSVNPIAWVEPARNGPLAFRSTGQTANTGVLPLSKLAASATWCTGK